MIDRIMYLRNSYKPKTCPVGCVAIRVETTENNDSEATLCYSLSVLNPLDKFDRKRAREIAKGRLDDGREEKIWVAKCYSASKVNRNDITWSIMKAILLNENHSIRARSAAAVWFGFDNFKHYQKLGCPDIVQVLKS